MIYLFLARDLRAYEITAAVFLLIVTVGLAALLGLGLWAPEILRGFLTWVQHSVNRLGSLVKRPDLLSEAWAENTFEEFTEAAVAIAAHPERLWDTLAVALVAHFIDLLSLAALFRAFHQPVSFGVLIAGYAMAVLFWIVSITPQGIGVVEGTMALVLTSLGVPAERATVIALSFRGLTFWLPLMIGFLLLRRVRSFAPPEVERPAGWRLRSEILDKFSSVWDVRLAAILTGLMGLVNVLSTVTPSLAERVQVLERFSPLEVRRNSHLTAALAGFALLMLAGNLWRRKRLAWLLTMAVLIISAISHLIKGLDYEEAILAVALAAWLIYMRPHFHARSDEPSVRQGIWALVGGLLFTVAYGVAGFYLLDRHFSVNFGFWAALRQTIVMFTQFYDPGLQPLTGFGRYFASSIYIVGAVTLGYAFLMLVRPVLARQKARPDEWQRAKAIVEAYGHTTLARIALLDDKLYWFSPGGSVVAYAVEGRVGMALGDPIGPARDFPASIAGFRTFCDTNDWIPAFYQTQPDTLQVYRDAGFQSLCIGHEGIVDLASFTLAGGENKNVRTMQNRLVRLGYRAEVIDPPVPGAMLHILRQISDDWLTMIRGTERRFSLGWFDEGYIGGGQVMLVRSPSDEITAFANIVPEYQRNEVTIDLMRHRPGAEKGSMDFLFVSLFEWAKAAGYTTFNLGLSALSGIGDSPEDPGIERALHYVYEHINQFYNFKGLHEFKEKFHPVWSPRYIVYPSAASLPQVTLAMIRADSGDDMISSYLRRRKRQELIHQSA
jgi:phosphatidylglycerol lysyltransferase